MNVLDASPLARAAPRPRWERAALRGAIMSELAFDASGEPIAFPAAAEELRVRRFRNPGMRGACEVVHDRDGAPLFIPVDATYLELRSLVDHAPGRYRLDPVDASRRVLADAEAAYVTINEAGRSGAGALHGEDRDLFLRELVRANADMARTIADRFAGVMQAAADLLRAADGAGLPQRAPAPVESVTAGDDDPDDEADDDDEAPSFDLADTVNQLLPLLRMWIATKTAPPAPVAPATAAAPAATPASPPEPAAPGTAPAAAPGSGESGVAAGSTSREAGDASAGAASSPPTVRNAAPPSPAQIAHLLAVQSRLTPDEQRVAQLAAMRMTAEVRATWLDELGSMSVDEAVARVRSLIPAHRERKGGAT
jgi:hypothetical protein